jgi:lipopolysaccharide export LptBFGC system permease protein LptF
MKSQQFELAESSQFRIYYNSIIGFFSSIFLTYFNQEIAPITQKQFSTIYYDIAYQRPTLKLEENSFTEIENYRLFVKKINRKKSLLKEVIIYKLDEKEYPILITAKNGRLIQKKNGLASKLYDGIIQKKY